MGYLDEDGCCCFGFIGGGLKNFIVDYLIILSYGWVLISFVGLGGY